MRAANNLQWDRTETRIPAFRNDQDEARFWETQDSTEFLAEFAEDRETVFVRPDVGIIEM